ncbi:SDR family NAD(P)-dependent oxidoreductase [Nocardioides sp. zg-DK7169]|uniref:SDR family NAD(P)-dependent oxidoreductase n=1 Tax=Nocardioides sp. zg-DK7169 TaxID=2736600 RepID=UPI001555D898|nr:SDR family NAD(P)-dependent oxidoreductase [Nocardioides sp. zg-DK7169]NPC97442.1 SDR family NAD(P)-dependent oxidoreductase [Nocardioides sp. zg-DK7169]
MGGMSSNRPPEPAVHVVTGATAGLGLETAARLAEQGHHVVLCGRGQERLEAARATILERQSDASLDLLELDLASLEQVRRAAGQVRHRYESVDVLISNAGVMYTPLERTSDGFEWQFGVNHLGHFEWTKQLMPLLLAGSGARVVNLSSAGHRAHGVDLADANWERRPYDKFAAYAASKTANILFTVELERRSGRYGVHAFAVHPGTVNTTLGRYMTREDMRHLKQLVAERAGAPSGEKPPPLVYSTVQDGAATSVWAATSHELDGRGGLYLSDCAENTPAPHAVAADQAEELWRLSEALCGTWDKR